MAGPTTARQSLSRFLLSGINDALRLTQHLPVPC